MKKYIIHTLLMAVTLFLVSCGSNDKIDKGLNAYKNSTLFSVEPSSMTSSGGAFTSTIPFTKLEGSDVTVSLSNFTLDVIGCNVVGTPTITPNPLVLNGVKNSQKDLQISGNFDNNCTPTGYKLAADKTITVAGQSATIDAESLLNVTLDSNGNPTAGGGGVVNPVDPNTTAENNNSFFNVPQPLNITEKDTIYNFQIQLIDNKLKGVAGELVTILAFDNRFGTMRNLTVNTDNNGFANFQYTSPPILPNSNITLSVVYDPAGVTVDQENIVLRFNGSTTTGDAPTMEVLPQELNISKNAEEKDIDVYVKDNTGKVFSNTEVNVEVFSRVNGNMSRYSAFTDINGHVVFKYIAPADIGNLDGQSFDFKIFLASNDTISKQVTVAFNENALLDYTLTNANDINISFEGETKEIAVQLLLDGVPQSGQRMVARSIPVEYGTITNGSSVFTDASGYARFTYVAATPLTDANTTVELIYTDLTGKSISAIANIIIGGQVQASEYNLTNATTPIVVNVDNEIKTISVDVVDARGIGVPNQEVSISAVSNSSFGAIVSSSTTRSNASGHAVFSYQAPSDVSTVDGNSTVLTLFMQNNGVTIEQNVTIEFSKAETNIVTPIVVIADNFKELNLTSNSQNVQIVVQVYEQGTNVRYSQGNVRVSLPDSVLTGVDVGNFTEFVVPVGTDGTAIFNFTGPQDIKTLIENNETGAVFKFYHEENSGAKVDVKTVYSLLSDYIPANYILSTSSSDGEQTMGLQLLKTFTLTLKDDLDNLVKDEDITKITIESQNILIGQLIDANTGAKVTKLTLNGADAVNSFSFPVQTYKLSGLLPIEISVEFNDGNGQAVTKTINMNVVVFSGPPTAISISYAGVDTVAGLPKYFEKFVVTVTDAYSNPVNSRPYISVGSMVEYAVDGSSTTGVRTTTSPRLWHGAYDTTATLEPIGGNKAQLTTTSDAFDYIDINNDKLVIFGTGFVLEALGKWDIDSASSQALQLKDDYNGSTRENLYFAVGHNNRQDLCANDGRTYLGTMKADKYQLDDLGHAFVTFEYDYHLTGKDIMIWANLVGFQADNNQTGRIGKAKKHTLRGNGLVSPNKYTLPIGAPARPYGFEVHHENAPEWYRNGHFGYAIKGTCQVENVIDHSNNYDARACINTIGFVDLNVSNPGQKACTISIDSIAVSPEFLGATYY